MCFLSVFVIMRNNKRKGNKSRKNSGSAGQDGMGTVNVPRLLRRGDSVVHKAIRSNQLAQIDSNTTSDVLVGKSFRLSDLPNITQFTNLYDEYRIDAIEVTLMPNLTNISQAVASPNNFHMGTIATAIDYDSDTAAANKAALLSYETLILHGPSHPDKCITRKWVPAVRIATYDSSPGFASGGVKQLQWIDTANPNAEHFGLQVGLFNGDASLNYSYFLYFTCWMTFRKVL